MIKGKGKDRSNRPSAIQTSTRSGRDPVEAEDAQVGCILRMNYEEDLPCIWSQVPGHPCAKPGLKCRLNQEGQRHPVVVVGRHMLSSNDESPSLHLSFVQVTHKKWLDKDSGLSAYSPYSHCTWRGKFRYFPRINRSRYWLKETRFLARADRSNRPLFRLPHVFMAPITQFQNYEEGSEARAYDLRLEEDSYIRLMQRLNLVAKPYIPDQRRHNTNGLGNNSNNTVHQPLGHTIEDPENLASHILGDLELPESNRRWSF